MMQFCYHGFVLARRASLAALNRRFYNTPYASMVSIGSKMKKMSHVGQFVTKKAVKIRV